MNAIEGVPGGVLLQVHLQPRASRNEIAGRHGDALKIRITAPPVEGAANEALIRFLAERLGVGVRAVEITAGTSSRRKTLRILGVTQAEAEDQLRER